LTDVADFTDDCRNAVRENVALAIIMAEKEQCLHLS
jgi:hypothetical protein